MLREALTLHCQRVSKELMAFHIDLEERFEGFQDIVFPDRVKVNTIMILLVYYIECMISIRSSV